MSLLAVSIGYVAPNYAQYQLSPLAPSLTSEFAISASQFSSLFTAAMIPGILLSLVSGILIDKHNPKLVAGASFALSTLGAVINLLGNSYGTLFLGFVLTGVAATILNSCSAKLLGAWYKPSQLTSKIGIAFSFSTLSMTVALATTAFFPNRKAAFSVALALFVIALTCWCLLYRNNPERDGAVSTHADSKHVPAPAQPSLGALLKRVMSSRNVWLVGIALFFLMGPNVIMSSMGPTILTTRGIGSVAAGYYTSIYTIGALISCYVAPMLAKALRSVKRTVVIFTLAAAFCVAFGWRAPEGLALGIAFFLAGFFVGGCIPLLISLPITFKGIGEQLAGTAGGLVATVELLGAVVLPSFVILPMAGDNLGVAFLLAGVCAVAACLLAAFLPKQAPATDSKPQA